MKDLYLSTFKKYIEFKGRAGKKEFWTFTLINFILSIIISVVAGIIKLPILASIYSLVILLPSLGVFVRRMNDINKEWWFVLIPFYNLYLALQESHPGVNEHGAQPIE